MLESNRNQLKRLISRIENVEEEKRALSKDIKELYEQGKNLGFNVKAMKALVKERRQDPDEKRDLDAILDEYREALGQLIDTPLGDAAQKLAKDIAEGARFRSRSTAKPSAKQRLTEPRRLFPFCDQKRPTVHRRRISKGEQWPGLGNSQF
jgi:uncharacterized protein (UPF0335 family)